MAEQPQTKISWSANVEYLKSFSFYFQQAQHYYRLCRHERRYLIHLFDAIHEIYRQETPYFDEKAPKGEKSQLEKMEGWHNELEQRVDKYFNEDEFYQRNNFTKLRRDIDKFFTVLTRIGVKKTFFPKTIKDRTGGEIIQGLREQ